MFQKRTLQTTGKIDQKRVSVAEIFAKCTLVGNPLSTKGLRIIYITFLCETFFPSEFLCIPPYLQRKGVLRLISQKSFLQPHMWPKGSCECIMSHFSAPVSQLPKKYPKCCVKNIEIRQGVSEKTATVIKKSMWLNLLFLKSMFY